MGRGTELGKIEMWLRKEYNWECEGTKRGKGKIEHLLPKEYKCQVVKTRKEERKSGGAEFCVRVFQKEQK
jgi:hypothetical protein